MVQERYLYFPNFGVSIMTDILAAKYSWFRRGHDESWPSYNSINNEEWNVEESARGGHQGIASTKWREVEKYYIDQICHHK